MKRSWIAAFAVAAGVVLNFAIPPFQNPDEPVHFGAVLRVSLGESHNAASEKEIIRLMDRNNWWRFVGMGRPAPLPKKLGEIRYLMDGATYEDSYIRIRGLLVYHVLAGRILRLTGIKGIEASYYLLRLLSLLLFLAALGFLAAGFGRLAGSADPVFAAASVLVLLVPQFLITSMAVSPDMLCVALGAAFFYAAVAVFEGRASAGHWVLAFFAAAAGFLTDKSVFVLLPLALLLVAFRIDRKNSQKALALVPALLLVGVATAYVLVLLFPLRVENSFRLVKEGLAAGVARGLSAIFAWNDFSRRFVAGFVDSFYLKFGWMAFPAGRAIVLAWRALLAAAGAGLALFLITLPFAKRAGGRRANPVLVRAALFSLVALALQVLGVRLSSSPENIYAQGRYLFPVLGFGAVLFALGTQTAVDAMGAAVRAVARAVAGKTGPPGEPLHAGEFALKALAVPALFLLTIVIWYYIVPVFHMTIKAPHNGL